MSRILAIDYGSKRVGIAVTDSQQLIAGGLTTLHPKDVMAFLKEYLLKEEVECFVVGEPKQMNNKPSQSAEMIERFVKSLTNEFPYILIEIVDERFTSIIALQTMLSAGLKKKDRQNKKLVDKISATIILQAYMESKSSFLTTSGMS